MLRGKTQGKNEKTVYAENAQKKKKKGKVKIKKEI
jgi:hypothetical protein